MMEVVNLVMDCSKDSDIIFNPVGRVQWRSHELKSKGVGILKKILVR